VTLPSILGVVIKDAFSKRQRVRPPGFGTARASVVWMVLGVIVLLENMDHKLTPLRDVGQAVHSLCTTTFVDNVGSPDASSSTGHTSKAGVIVDDGSGTRGNTSTGEYSILILLSSVTACRQMVVTDNGQVAEVI
ncbi:hypothetical protein Tco_1497040, partial [Tanacetum coccineum]